MKRRLLNASAAEDWRAQWEHEFEKQREHDRESQELLDFPIGPTVPDPPRPLAKRYGPNWQSRPDADELEREFRRQASARAKALKEYKRHVEESNMRYRSNPDDEPGVELDYEYGEWIPVEAVRFNEDGSVSLDQGMMENRRRNFPTIGNTRSHLRSYAGRLAQEYPPGMWEDLVVAELKRMERRGGRINDEVFDDLVRYGVKEFEKFG